MRYSLNYRFNLPERLPERNDPADIDDLTANWMAADSIMREQADNHEQLQENLADHKTAYVLDHPDGSVTDAKIGNRSILGTGGALQALFDRIGGMFKAVTGKDTWNAEPDITLAGAAVLKEDFDGHAADGEIHTTQEQKDGWDGHVADGDIHVSEEDRARWDEGGGGGTVQTVNTLAPDDAKNVQVSESMDASTFFQMEEAGTIDPDVMYFVPDGVVPDFNKFTPLSIKELWSGTATQGDTLTLQTELDAYPAHSLQLVTTSGVVLNCCYFPAGALAFTTAHTSAAGEAITYHARLAYNKQTQQVTINYSYYLAHTSGGAHGVSVVQALSSLRAIGVQLG